MGNDSDYASLMGKMIEDVAENSSIYQKRRIIDLANSGYCDEEIAVKTHCALGYVQSVLNELFVDLENMPNVITKEKLDNFTRNLKPGRKFKTYMTNMKAINGGKLLHEITLKQFYPFIAVADVTFHDINPNPIMANGRDKYIIVNTEMSFRYADLYMMDKIK